MSVNHFIFGYGSLINKDSRAKTGQTSDAMATMVKGIKREWNLVVPKFGFTTLGATFNESAFCNGVIVSVLEQTLSDFDAREVAYGYSRIQLQKEMAVPFNNGIIPDGNIWTYVTDSPGKPSEDTPLVQSYIDVVLAGCWDFGRLFVEEFINKTQGWDAPWINDRENPRYMRPMKEVPLSCEFDSILKDLVPGSFNERT